MRQQRRRRHNRPRQYALGHEHDSFETSTTQIGRFRLRTCISTPALTIFVAYAQTSSYEEELEAFFMDLERLYREDHTFSRLSSAISRASHGTHGTKCNE
uniref:Uncharacterized protein n=1 Tax=Haemonchus contortus TaxID=6289 RepID=A0A7I4YRG1_HAECO